MRGPYSGRQGLALAQRQADERARERHVRELEDEVRRLRGKLAELTFRHDKTLEKLSAYEARDEVVLAKKLQAALNDPAEVEFHRVQAWATQPGGYKYFDQVDDGHGELASTWNVPAGWPTVKGKPADPRDFIAEQMGLKVERVLPRDPKTGKPPEVRSVMQQWLTGEKEE